MKSKPKEKSVGEVVLHNLLAFREMCYFIWVHSATITILVYIHNIQWVIVGCDVLWLAGTGLKPNNEAKSWWIILQGAWAVELISVSIVYTHDISDTWFFQEYMRNWQIFVRKYTKKPFEKWAWRYITNPIESRERPLPIHLDAYTYRVIKAFLLHIRLH